MGKNSYPIANQTPSILTQVNPTYNGKEIPQTIITTRGILVQSAQRISTSNSKGQTKSRKH